MDKLFGKKPTPAELAKQWQRELNSEARKIDRQISKIQVEERKAIAAAKQAAKKNDTVAVRMLSKDIIRSRHATRRMYTARTQMNSVGMQLQQQVSQLKLAGSMQKSTDVMRQMNSLTNVREVQQVMMAMSKEMARAGLIDEMMNDTIDDALDDDISDSELDAEVGKVVDEVMQGVLGGAQVRGGRLPQKQAQQAPEEDIDEDELMAKFNALNNS